MRVEQVLHICGTALSANWGSIPDWFAAVGTVGAVILALRSAGAEGRRRDQEAAGRTRSSIRAITVNLSDITDNLMMVRVYMREGRVTVTFSDRDGRDEAVELTASIYGLPHLQPVALEQSHLDLLEPDLIITGRYRLVLKRYEANLASITDYGLVVQQVISLQSEAQIGSAVSRASRLVLLRSEAERARRLSEQLERNIADSLLLTAQVADEIREFLSQSQVNGETYVTLDTGALRMNEHFPNGAHQ